MTGPPFEPSEDTAALVELVDWLLDHATDDLLDDRAFAEMATVDEQLDRPLFSPDGRRALRAAIAKRSS